MNEDLAAACAEMKLTAEGGYARDPVEVAIQAVMDFIDRMDTDEAPEAFEATHGEALAKALQWHDDEHIESASEPLLGGLMLGRALLTHDPLVAPLRSLQDRIGVLELAKRLRAEVAQLPPETLEDCAGDEVGHAVAALCEVMVKRDDESAEYAKRGVALALAERAIALRAGLS